MRAHRAREINRVYKNYKIFLSPLLSLFFLSLLLKMFAGSVFVTREQGGRGVLHDHSSPVLGEGAEGGSGLLISGAVDANRPPLGSRGKTRNGARY